MIRPLTVLLLIGLPLGASAQGLSVATFGATNRALRDAPGLVGLAVTAWSGPFGLRVGGAMDVPSSPLAPVFGYPPTDATGAWSGDLDLVFSGGRMGLELARIEPGAFVGVGVHGARLATGQAATVPMWSYGATAALPLASWLSLEGEARYRMAHEADPAPPPAAVGGGWEWRAGVTLHLGRRSPHRPAVPPAGPPRATGRRGPATIHIGGSRSPAERDADLDRIAHGVLTRGEAYVGVPYVWGGDTPSQGFDCSGFVQYVYARQGIPLPRVSRDQARAGRWLPPRYDALRPGDLVFFAGADGVIDHVAIYAGERTILHSSGSRRGVGYDHLDSQRGRWYRAHIVAARRVIE